MVIFHPKTQKEHLVIGIAGTLEGLGVTHLCIALANYLASKKRKKTACLELSNSSAFSQLREYGMPALLPVKTSAHRSFQIYDVDYYPNVQKAELPALINTGYEVLILDFGLLHTDCLDELYRCDKKFILCSVAPWKQQDMFSRLTLYPQIKKMEYLFYMIAYGTRQDVCEIAKKLAVSRNQLHAVPFLQNPFHIEQEQFSFFEKLL